jgi:hypothetical protein
MPASKEIKAQRKAYLQSHPTCELFEACGRDFNAIVWAGMEWTHRTRRLPIRSTEVHHILGRGGPGDAAEAPCNWLAVSRPYHLWATEYSTEGRIVALWFKWLHKDKEPEGWDLARMQAVHGQIILGWLENQLTKELPVWVRTRAEEVLA